VTRQDVADFANRYLTRPKSTVGISKSKTQKGSGGGDKIGKPENRPCRFHPRNSYASDNAIQPEFTDYYQAILPNGLTVLVKQKTGVPVVSIRTWTNAGHVLEHPDKAGISNIVGQMLDEGTFDLVTSRNFEQISDDVEEMGAELETFSTGVKARCLSRHFEKTFKIVRDCIVYPNFPKERLDHVRTAVLEAIRKASDEPRSELELAYYRTVFKGTPLERPEIGFKETVEKLTVQDAMDHHKKFFRPRNTIIAIAGDISATRAILLARSYFSGWTNEGISLTEPHPRPTRQDSEVKLTYRRETDNLVNVYMGHVGIERTNPDYFALRVAENILG
jgi:zinc protease